MTRIKLWQRQLPRNMFFAGYWFIITAPMHILPTNIIVAISFAALGCGLIFIAAKLHSSANPFKNELKNMSAIKRPTGFRKNWRDDPARVGNFVLILRFMLFVGYFVFVVVITSNSGATFTTPEELWSKVAGSVFCVIWIYGFNSRIVELLWPFYEAEQVFKYRDYNHYIASRNSR